MSRKEKLLKKIISNHDDVRFDDLCKVLDYDGWAISSQNSSHYTYSKKGYGRMTIVKRSNGIVKQYYVKLVLKMMEVDYE